MLGEDKPQEWRSEYFYEGDRITKEVYKKQYKGDHLKIQLNQSNPTVWVVQSYAHFGQTEQLRYYHEITFVGFDAYLKALNCLDFKMCELEMVVDDITKDIFSGSQR